MPGIVALCATIGAFEGCFGYTYNDDQACCHVSFLAGCFHSANIGLGSRSALSTNGGVQIFYRDELLARTDVVEITTSRDVAYRTPRTYEPWRSRSYSKEVPFRPMPWWKRQRKTAS